MLQTNMKKIEKIDRGQRKQIDDRENRQMIGTYKYVDNRENIQIIERIDRRQRTQMDDWEKNRQQRNRGIEKDKQML